MKTCTSASWWHRYLSLLASLFNSQNLASIHEQKCFCQCCGIQHNVPRPLGGFSHTCALGSRQTDLRKGYGTQGACEPVLALLGHGHGMPGDCWLWQSPMDKKSFVEVQVSWGEFPVLCWGKKKKKKRVGGALPSKLEKRSKTVSLINGVRKTG